MFKSEQIWHIILGWIKIRQADKGNCLSPKRREGKAIFFGLVPGVRKWQKSNKFSKICVSLTTIFVADFWARIGEEVTEPSWAVNCQILF
jgi:hypothetical protein